MACYDCTGKAVVSDKEQIDAAKKAARVYARANGITELIIVKTINGYGYRSPGHESLARLREVDRILIV